RNVVSGNIAYGLGLFGTNATGNLVQGNYVGTNAAGSAAVKNNADGVAVFGGAHNNTIGGLTATPGTAPGNVLSGNSAWGIYIHDAGSNNNLVQGNLIGTDATGLNPVGNGYIGIQLQDTTGDTIGGTVAAARNVISANGNDGIYIGGASANNL